MSLLGPFEKLYGGKLYPWQQEILGEFTKPNVSFKIDESFQRELESAYKRYVDWYSKYGGSPSLWEDKPVFLDTDYAPPEPIVIHMASDDFNAPDNPNVIDPLYINEFDNDDESEIQAKIKVMKFKDIVASHLLAVCEEANALARSKLNDGNEKPPNNIKDETIKRLIEYLSANYSSMNQYLLPLFAEAFNDKRFLKGINKDEALFPIYSVILLTSKQSSHNYEINKPLIVSHAIKNQCLKYDGTTTANNPFFEADGPRLATSEEIKFCIENLSDAQWQTILTNASFSPVVNGAMDTEIEEVSDDKNE